jgi:hypothetical protein
MITLTGIGRLAVGVLALGAMACSAADGAGRGAPQPSSSPCEGSVFSSAGEPALAASTDVATLRYRAVRIDLARIRSMPERLVLNVFDDTCLTAVRQPDPSGPGPVPVWSGTVDGVPGSTVSIVLNGDTLMASIAHAPAAFVVEPWEGDVYRVREVDPSRYPSELPTPAMPPPATVAPPKPVETPTAPPVPSPPKKKP